MKKAIVIGTLLLGSLFAIRGEAVSIPSSPPIVFSSLEEKAWVEKCIDQHPEILWLADANVRKTGEGQSDSNGSYSEQLFGQKHIEFDRTIMTIFCLKLILDGSDKSYQTFTAAQTKDTRLSRESFNNLHLQAQQLLKSKWKGMSEEQMAQTMETALVLGDIGKSEKVRALFKPFGISAPDHDDFFEEAIQVLKTHPELCPSFAALPHPANQLIIKTANLAHYGHITHLEGGPEMFHKLKESALPYNDPLALSFDLFVHTCDVAGALGHVNNKSSLAYTENTHRALQATDDAVKTLINPHKAEWDAYNAYLLIRASWLGLNCDDTSDRVLTRVGAMLRLFTEDEGTILKKTFLLLDAKTRDQIINQLDVQHLEKNSRTPTYMPALLVNLSNNVQLGSSKEQRLSQAITLGLPFIAKVLERHHELLVKKEIDATIPLNFNKMAELAKTNPNLLNQDFYIDKEGNVFLK